MKQIQFQMGIFLLLIANTLTAQSPIWSINPNVYQYNMTVVATLELNCKELTDPSNKLGAFVDDTLRGIAHTSNVINGRYVATMSVYSSVASGEKVSFRFYDHASDSTYYSKDSVAFQGDAVYGSINAPYKVNTNNVPSGITLSNNKMQENEAAGQFIGFFGTVDKDLNQVHAYSFVNGMESNNNSFFSISENQLIADSTANYEKKNTYLIHVKTTDSAGCSFDSLMVIDVNNNSPGFANYNLDDASTYISPNADGYNDYWQIQNLHQYANYRLIIFSTNGEIVFEKSSNYSNEWDGTFNGKPLPEGVYYYNFQEINGQNNFKGTITLKR